MKTTIYIFLLITCFTFKANSQNIDKTALNNYLEALAKNDKFMGSVSILVDDKIIYNKTVGFSNIENKTVANNETKYKIGSVSKVFTAALTLKAIEENKLHLNTKLSTFFPNIINADKITIENLLNHSSGIYSITDEADYFDWNTKKMSEKDFLDKLTKNASQFEPNSKNEYSNSNYILLSYILEKTYKTNYDAILDKQIVQKLKLKNTYFGDKINENNIATSYSFNNNKWNKETNTHPSIPLGSGGITSTTTDLTKFIYSLFNQKIINENSLNQMIKISNDYGLGIFDLSYEENLGFGHDGAIDGFKSLIAIYPNIKTAFAITSNANNYNINLVSKTIQLAIFNEKIEIPDFRKINFTTEELNKFVGTFSAEGLPFKITISTKNLELIAEATGQSPLPLEAVDKNIFTFDKAGIKLIFKEEGKKMILSQSGMEIEMIKE